MSPELVDLGQRAVACEWWRWVEGMLAVRVEDGRKYRVSTVASTSIAYVPDFSDAPTVGGLLALLRESWGDPTIYCRYNGATGRWDVVGRYRDHASAATEAQALVATLERLS